MRDLTLTVRLSTCWIWRSGMWRSFARWFADLVVENLGDGRDSVVVIDDTQVIKQGTESVGVSRQHCGATGQVENRRVWVMMSMASRHGHAFFDRELYMPEPWVDDLARRAVAAVPADEKFMTKPGLAVSVPGRAMADEVTFGWVACDSGHGRDPGLRRFCHDDALRYVMAVAVDPPLVGAGEPSRCDMVLARTTDDLRERGSRGDGTKGTRTHDWSFHHVHVKDQIPSVGFEHTLLIRRSKEKKVTKKHLAWRRQELRMWRYWLVSPWGRSSAVALIADEAGYRGFEAWAAAGAVHQMLGYSADRQTFFFSFHSGGALRILGLNVSLGCSSVFLLAPMLLFTATLAAYSGKSLIRLGIAATVAAGVFMAVNLLRLVMIAGLMVWWGVQTGFGWGHTLFGSVLTLVGMAAACAAYFLIVSRENPLRMRRDRRSQRSASAP